MTAITRDDGDPLWLRDRFVSDSGDSPGSHHIQHVTAVTARVWAFPLHLPSSEASMSTAVVERIAEERPKLDLVPLKPAIYESTEQWDPHPLIPVVVAGAVSLVLALAFIGSVLAWLALRHSGVMAP
jgi:hypothetical protein